MSTRIAYLTDEPQRVELLTLSYSEERLCAIDDRAKTAQPKVEGCGIDEATSVHEEHS